MQKNDIAEWYRVARNLLIEKKYKDARDAFLVLCLVAPEYQNFWHGLSHAYFGLEEFKQALYSIENACLLGPNTFNVHIFKIRIYEEIEDFEAAYSVVESLEAEIEEVNRPFLQEIKKSLDRKFNQIMFMPTTT